MRREGPPRPGGSHPSKADVLVTFNVKDFPDHALASFNVEVVHPDDFLLDQLDLFPGLVTQVLRELAGDCVDPPCR